MLNSYYLFFLRNQFKFWKLLNNKIKTIFFLVYYEENTWNDRRANWLVLLVIIWVILTSGRNRSTRSVWISGVGLFATANGYVIRYTTVCVDTASSGTRIDTLVPWAALIAWAIRVQQTLGSARSVRVANVAARTNAIDSSVLRLTLSVCATRIWITRSRWLDDIRFD